MKYIRYLNVNQVRSSCNGIANESIFDIEAIIMALASAQPENISWLMAMWHGAGVAGWRPTAESGIWRESVI